MGSRIEVVEVLSFRLQVPRRALEQLPSELAPELDLRLVASEDGRLLLMQHEADSVLRFRQDGDVAELTDVAIAHDEDGRFFQAVLGALMVRFGGDLRVRLVFEPADERGEPWAEVRIDGGRTSYPGLATRAAAARLAHAASEAGPVRANPLDPEPEEPEEPAGAPPSPEDEELALLLHKAREAWQEYQRLKAARRSP
jgi:hypothetical protein